MIELKVTRMHCKHCLDAVEKALAEVQGVTEVARVELQSGGALVAATPDVQALVATLRAAAYSAEPERA
jgi:copper chaperone CopZ